jgi:hypothetical protein
MFLRTKAYARIRAVMVYDSMTAPTKRAAALCPTV